MFTLDYYLILKNLSHMKQKSKLLRFFPEVRRLLKVFSIIVLCIVGYIQDINAQVAPTAAPGCAATIQLPIYTIDRTSLEKLLSKAKGRRAELTVCLELTTDHYNPNSASGSYLMAYVTKKHWIHFFHNRPFETVYLPIPHHDANDTTINFHPYIVSNTGYDAYVLKKYLDSHSGATIIQFSPDIVKDPKNTWDDNYHLIYNITTNSAIQGRYENRHKFKGSGGTVPPPNPIPPGT